MNQGAMIKVAQNAASRFGDVAVFGWGDARSYARHELWATIAPSRYCSNDSCERCDADNRAIESALDEAGIL